MPPSGLTLKDTLGIWLFDMITVTEPQASKFIHNDILSHMTVSTRVRRAHNESSRARTCSHTTIIVPLTHNPFCVMSTPADENLTEAMSNLSTDDVAARAAELKAAGNKLFIEKKYDEAIKIYGDAIAVQENAILYCNRAASHLALQS